MIHRKSPTPVVCTLNVCPFFILNPSLHQLPLPPPPPPPPPPLYVQVQYSLLDQRPLMSGLVPLCLKHGIKILAYGVLAGGFLTDTWLGSPPPDTSVSSTWPFLQEPGRFANDLCDLSSMSTQASPPPPLKALNARFPGNSEECNKVIVPFARRERFSCNASLSTIDYCAMRRARKRHPGTRRVHIRYSNVEADVAVYL